MKEFSIDNFFGEATLMKATQLYSAITKEMFTVKDVGFTYKIMNLWQDTGVLLGARDKDAKWRRFSFVEFVWLYLVHELRTFGTSLKLIKKFRDQVSEEIPFSWLLAIIEANMENIETTEDKESIEALKKMLLPGKEEEIGFSIFLLLVVESIVKKTPITLILFNNGDWLALHEDKNSFTKEEIEKLAFEPHIRISLAKVLRNFLYKESTTFVLPALKILEENEIRILQILNSGEYETVTINFKNKKMKSLELIKQQDVRKKVVDVLAESSYQDIVIKTHNGLITKIQNTVTVVF